jgi:isovaleryl-CoA dehydrogenase
LEFHLSEEQFEVQRTVRKFAENEIAPVAEAIDRDDQFPREAFKKMGDLGLLALLIPEKCGGTGAGVITFCVVGEEISAASASVGLSYGSHAVLCAHTLASHGSEEQNRRYLPGLASGEKIGAMALTEPEAGSDALAMHRTAVNRNGEYVLNGTKTFITNGPVADILLVCALTDKDAGPGAVAAFIVEKTSPGFSVGKELKKRKRRGSPTSELVFENCRVPKENLLAATVGVAVG